MSVKKIILLISLIFAVNAHSMSDLFQTSQIPMPDAQNPIANLGPFAVGYEFCQNIQQIASILQVYSTAQWPVVGVGYTLGVVQNSSPLMTMCQYLTQLRTMNTENAIFHSGRYLNTLTGNKWDNHLAQADLTWNVANSLIDLRGSGQFRKGALTQAHNHKRLLDFADKTKKYYDKEFTDNEGPSEGIESRAERRAKLDRISNIAAKRAVLSEASQCPNPNVSKDYAKEYQTKIVPIQQKLSQSTRYATFYHRQLIKMGPDLFQADIRELERYNRTLEVIANDMFGYTATIQTQSVERTVPTGKIDKTTGKPVVETVQTKRRGYQQVRVRPNFELFNEFKEEMVPLWEKFITSQILSAGTHGLLDGPRGRIEEKYRDFGYECSEIVISQQLPVKDRNDPNYTRLFREKQNECRDRLKIREGVIDAEGQKFVNLMDNYLLKWQRELQTARQSQAQIWTFESMYMGTIPIPVDPTNEAEARKFAELEADQRNREEASCRPEFTPAEMAQIQNELQNVENELLEEIMKTSAQASLMEEEKLKKEYENEKQRQEEIEKEDNQRSNYQGPAPAVIDFGSAGGI